MTPKPQPDQEIENNNSVSFFIAALGLIACLSYGVIPPTHGGFYCDDATIDFKYTKDSFSTILLIIISFIPIYGVVIKL